MSILDQPETTEAAPTWRCPACRTQQPQATRCWRCDEPAFTCATCLHFRASLAVELGYCASDPSRTPLAADEVRSCWQAASSAAPAAAPASAAAAPGLFAESEIAPAPPRGSAIPASTAPPAPPAAPGAAGRGGRRAPPKAKPPLEAPGRAAWVEHEGDALVEAPLIEPAKCISTEVQRRRRWFR